MQRNRKVKESAIIRKNNKAKFDALSNGQAIEVLSNVAQWALSEISKILLLVNDEEKSVLEELKLEQTEAYKLSRNIELSAEERDMWYDRATKASNIILQMSKANNIKVGIFGLGITGVVLTIVLTIINQEKQ